MVFNEEQDELEAAISGHLQKKGKNNLHILVSGRTGAGKSALVNSIIGEYITDEGDSPLGETRGDFT